MVTLLVTSLFLMGALFPEIRNKVTLFFDTEEPCRQKDYDLSADPVLFVPLPEIQKIFSADSSDTKTLLLLAGNCNGCSSNALKEIVKIGTEKGFSIHIIHQNKLPEKLKEDLGNLGVSSFIQDADSKIHKKLNAIFSPRVYVVDESFRLLSIQKQFGIDGAVKTMEENMK